MENFRAIIIGIDSYRHCPPLKSSENNAQALYRYLFEEAQIPSHQLLLLTDTSPSPGKYSTYPNQENIRQWVNDGSTSVKMGWFFFQGYGVNYQGQDYLIPIDGQPKAIAQTGIHLRSLLERLQRTIQQPIIILDLKPIGPDKGLGEQVITFAQKRGITLILSTQSPENSSVGVKFTDALLEALRYYRHDLTLQSLEAYLRERLLILKSSPDKSVGKLVVINPTPQNRRQTLIPAPTMRVKQTSGQSVIKKASATHPSLTLPTLPKVPAVSSLPTEGTPSGHLITLSPPHPITPSPRHSITPSPPHPITPSPRHSVTPSPQSLSTKTNWKWFFLGVGTLVFIGLLGAVYIRFKGTSMGQINESHENKRLILNKAKIPLSFHQASRLNEGISIARKIPPNTPFYEEAQTYINRWTETILDIAQGRAIKGDFQGAITAAQLVPYQQKELYSLAQESIKYWQKLSQQKQYNEVLIDAAQGLIKPNQASSYNRAITTLRYITPEEPGYDIAQPLIEKWSQQIYQLAQVRGTQGQFSLAIQTAQLIPDYTLAYDQAQRAIAQWQNKLEH
jgi:hypothetical protein